MSIINPDDEIKSEISTTSTIKSISKHLFKEKHINSRNRNRNCLSNANSQISTKEGIPNQEGIVDNKTVDAYIKDNDLDNISIGSSSHNLSNITKILNQNNYNYATIRNKIQNITNNGDSNQFVYNMLSQTTTLRAEKIKERLSEINTLTQITKTTQDNNEHVKHKDNKKKINKKDRISCCFFFGK